MHYNDQGADFKYLIVNERDKRFGLSVTTVGFQAIRAGSVYPPRNHPDAYYFTAQKGRVLHEYQLVYITKGRGTFASDTTPSVDISKGQILFLFPGQWHTYAPLQKTGWNEYYIGFEGPIIDNLVKNSFISKESQILDIGINEELATFCPCTGSSGSRQDRSATIFVRHRFTHYGSRTCYLAEQTL